MLQLRGSIRKYENKLQQHVEIVRRKLTFG
jgi:hypothetical protein